MEKHHNTLVGMEVPPNEKQTISANSNVDPLTTVDPAQATDMLIHRMATGSWAGTASGFDALTAWNARLAEGNDPQAIRQALARQSVLLEQAFLLMMANGFDSKHDDSEIFFKAAVSFQQAGLRTLVALASMGEKGT